MKMITTVAEMSDLAKKLKKDGRSIGLVPTMGYLHEGHLSLAGAARKETDVVVMSIFVNPTQFGPGEDFENYPRDLERDKALASGAGVDALFTPSGREMYPEGYSTYITVERLDGVMCGASRPGHFRAVATVVAKLFSIVGPEKAYFGQKDAQQAVLVKRMVRDLNMKVDVRVMPIVREQDGLAMSSRNVYLSKAERADAAVIYGSLKAAESLVNAGERRPEAVKAAITDMIGHKRSVMLEYVTIVDVDDLREIGSIRGEALIAVAARVGKTRLIDNITVKAE